MRLTELFDMTVSEFEEFLSGYTLDDIKACGRLTRHNKPLANIFKLYGFPNYKHKGRMKVLKKINKYGISSLTLGWPQGIDDHVVLTFHGFILSDAPYVSILLNIIINSDMSVVEIESDKYVHLNSTLDRNKTLADYCFERA